MRRWPVAAIAVLALAAAAAEPDPGDLPPREVVARWLSTDPAVREAESALSAATHGAGMLRASPNEWTINSSSQRRRDDAADATSREWNIGLEHSVRVPGKRRIDTALGARGIDIAQARYRASVQQALLDLSQLWLDWIVASAAHRLAERQAALVGDNRSGVAKRVAAGDAARLDLNLADADVADVERLRAEARAQQARARARLLARFPAVPDAPPALSEPTDDAGPASERIAVLVAASLAVQIAEAERAEAETGAERQRADRVPDPTVGVFTGSEAFGNERIVGVTLSVPLSGRYRSQKLAQALDTRDQREAALARERQRAQADAADLVSAEQGGVEQWTLARTAAQRAEENAVLTQRAYTLGEADLHTVLLAQRQSLQAERTVLDTQAAALHAHYRRRIQSGNLWADLGPRDPTFREGGEASGDASTLHARAVAPLAENP